jgi:restriction endonuclease S subunit
VLSLNNISSWPKKQLRDVCTIDPSKKEINGIDQDIQVSFGMMADLGEHTRVFRPKEARYLSEVKKGGYSYFKTKDVLLAKMTPCFENGKSGIATDLKNDIGFGSTEFYVIRPSLELDPELLYYYVSSDKFINEGKFSLVGTTGRRRLLKQFIELFEIPIPPYEDQCQLNSLLKSFDTTIENLVYQEKSLLNLQNTLLNGLLGKNPHFGDLINEVNYHTTTFGALVDCIESHDKYKNEIDRFIGLENIETGNFKITSWGDISKGTTFTKKFQIGDTLFGKRRSYLRKVAMADFDGICSGDILVFRARKGAILTELLPFYVASDAFIQHAVTTSAGSLSPRTKWKDLKEFELTMPDLKTQKSVSEVFQVIKILSSQLNDQKVTLKTLKHHLLNEILG